jgi:hypothetical protein
VKAASEPPVSEKDSPRNNLNESLLTKDKFQLTSNLERFEFSRREGISTVSSILPTSHVCLLNLQKKRTPVYQMRLPPWSRSGRLILNTQIATEE